MPCNTVTVQSVKLAKGIPFLIEETLKDLGWRLDGILSDQKTTIVAMKGNNRTTWRKGKGLEVRGRNANIHIEEITKTYSKQAVTWAATRAGWNVNNTSQDKLTILRR